MPPALLLCRARSHFHDSRLHGLVVPDTQEPGLNDADFLAESDMKLMAHRLTNVRGVGVTT